MEQAAKELFETVEEYFQTREFKQFFHFVDAAIYLAQQIADVAKEIHLLLNKAVAYYQLGDSEVAVKTIRKLQPFEKHMTASQRIRYLNTVAAIYHTLDDRAHYYEYLMQAYALATDMNEEIALLFLEGNLGHYYYEMKEYAKSFMHMERCLMYCERLNFEAHEPYIIGRVQYINTSLELGKMNIAEAQFEWLEQFPHILTNHHYVLAKGHYYCICGDKQRAYELLAQVIRHDGQHETILSTLYERFLHVAEEVETLEQYVETLETYYHYLGRLKEAQAKKQIDQMKIYLNTELLEEMLWHDPLTKVKNRRYLDEKMPIWLDEQHSFVGLLLFDADHFKQINDCFGHRVGDEVICLMAERARQFFSSESAVVIRYGGDEFVVFYSVKQLEGIEVMLAQFHAYMQQCAFTVKGEVHHVSISIGATVVRANVPIEVLLEEADRALYQSKQQGRNRYTQFQQHA